MLFDQKTNLDTGGVTTMAAGHHETKVTAPRNPTLNRGPKIEPKVKDIFNSIDILGISFLFSLHRRHF